MPIDIIRGKIPHAQKVVVYGPEGVGKSTFASHFPDPLFLDTEGSTRKLDVARAVPTSWTALLQMVRTVQIEKPCKTLVIDTADWAERLCIQHVCAVRNFQSIEDAGYGKGYTYLYEEFGKFLNMLEEVVRSGINVVMTAHSQITKFEQPDELGAYDRWELKLQKKVAPMVKEWADMVLFANYKTVVVTVDKQGKKAKAQGGQQRVMYTCHTAAWDAKNRDGLPDMLPFEFGQIAHIFDDAPTQPQPQPKPQPKEEPKPIDLADGVGQPQIYEPPKNNDTKPINEYSRVVNEEYSKPEYSGLPSALLDLMKMNRVSEKEIRQAVSKRGYFPENMPVNQYPEDFINGVLVGAWDGLLGMIKEMNPLTI